VPSCSSESDSACTEPSTSPLMIRLSVAVLPSASMRLMSVSFTPRLLMRSCFSRSRRWRVPEISLARSAVHHDQVSPAPGTPAMPRTCTGMPGPASLYRLAALVEHGADAAVVVAAHERVADAQRAVRHQHRRDGALADVELCLDHGALRRASGFAFRSSISAWSRILSSRSGTPVPFFALTSAASICRRSPRRPRRAAAGPA
jgi:hypothetical protein